MSKPTFIFIPGAWHTPSVFQPVTARLESLNCPTIGFSLPSVGANPGIPDFRPDVTALQTLIHEQLSLGKDLILVMWSYGAVPGTEGVLPEMLKPARAQAGKQGGVVHLVYLAAPILPVGMSVEKSRPQEPAGASGMVNYDLDAGTVSLHPDLATMMFFNDVDDPTIAKELAAGMKSMSVGPLRSELTRAAWMYTPSTAVFCEKDLGLPLERAEAQLKAAREIQPGCFERVERCGAAHVPFVTMPEFVVGVLRRAAGEKV